MLIQFPPASLFLLMQVVDIDGESGSSSLTSDEVGSVHLTVHFFSVA